MIDTSTWTYGCEHELADWPMLELAAKLPGYGFDSRDITIVNSNGIANDPSGKLYSYGGEIQTPPTSTPFGQCDCLFNIRTAFPMAKVNYRSNLHVHVRVPGLREDLGTLKQLLSYIHRSARAALAFVEPITRPTQEEYPLELEFAGALRRWRRRKVSHQFLSPGALKRQMAAKSLEEFFVAEYPLSNGKRQPQLQPRQCISLRQLQETDTIEFRHFPGTLDTKLLWNCVAWCRVFLQHALEDKPIVLAIHKCAGWAFPFFPRYIHWMERNYRNTVHDGTLSKESIAANIREILGHGA